MARKSRKDAAALTTPKKTAMKIWRAALYIRLSVEFNGKKGDSLETQRQIMEAYIALCPDIEIAVSIPITGPRAGPLSGKAFSGCWRT